jgi:membrane protein
MADITCSVDVEREPRVAFDRWTESTRFPAFMGGAGPSIRSGTNGSGAGGVAAVDWKDLLAGPSSEAEAGVAERVPGEHIAWSAGAGDSISGVVRFEPLSDDRARVLVAFDVGDEAGLDVGDRLIVRRRLQDDLEAFRHEIRYPADAQPPAGGATPAASGAGEEAPRQPPNDRRGREADSPQEIPARGWLDILKRTVKQLKSDNIPIVAAGVAFYVFLALVPALIAVISVYGLVAEPADVQRQLESALAALPPEAADLVLTQVEMIVEQGRASLGIGLVVSIVVALFAASKGMLSMVTALNIAYDEEETRKFLRLRGLALLLTVGAALAAVAGVGAMVVVANLAEVLGTFGEVVVTVVRWPVLAALAALILAVLYRYAPDRDAAAWRWVTPGAVAATLLWLVASVGFSVYVRNFGSYNETYGSLAAVVVLLLWLFLTAYAIVFGAELDSEAERQTVRDSTRGAGQPLGQRRAHAADTVAG